VGCPDARRRARRRYHRLSVTPARCLLISVVALTLLGTGRAGAADRCATTVGEAGALAAAVDGGAYQGRVVCARGSFPRLELRGRHDQLVTLRAVDGATVDGIELDGVRNLRVEGFRFTGGGVDTERSGVDGLTIAGNRFEDYVGSALYVWGGDANVTFEHNVVRNMRFDGQFSSGWGVSAIGDDGGIRNLVIRYNSFTHTEQDAMEIGDAFGGQIVGNVVRDVKPPPGSDAHTDSLMLWSNSQDFLIKDNRFEDGYGVLMSGSTSDVRMENNLIVRMENLCHDGGPTGSSDEGLVRYTWVGNTIYDCGSGYNGGGPGGLYGFRSQGPATAGASNHAERNLFTSMDIGTPAQFSYEDYNVVVNGRARGAHDVRLKPRFRDRVDYQATNLPFRAGYTPAPAGPRPCGGRTGRARDACRLRMKIARTCSDAAHKAACAKRVRALAACKRRSGAQRRAACRRKARRVGHPAQVSAIGLAPGAHPGWARPFM
jgi:hypothetical protein